MGALLLALGLAFVALAVSTGGALWVLVWPALSLLLVGGSYFAEAPWIFGKRDDGSIPLLPRIVFLPFEVGVWIHYWTSTSRRGDPYNEVAPGIYIGRRPLPGQVPPDAGLIVDMCAELPANPDALGGRRYINFPTHETVGPPIASFQAVLDRLADEPEPILIHCASGRGRSPTLAAALFVRRGITSSIDEAVQLIERARPSISLHRPQRRRALEIVRAQLGPPDRSAPWPL